MSNILLEGGWGEGGIYSENLFVCKTKFWTAIVMDILVERRSSLSILIPLKITSSFFCLEKLENLGM